MSASVTGPKSPTRAAVLLAAFLKKNAITQLAASQALNVSDPTIHDWIHGSKRPKTHHREAIAVWTHDEVPIEAWLRDDERASMLGVQPFTPPPPADSTADISADDTGERAAVTADPANDDADTKRDTG